MANHLLDRQLETELNRNIDFIVKSSGKLSEDEEYTLEVPDLTFNQVLTEVSKAATDILNTVNVLRPAVSEEKDKQYKQYCDPAVKSAGMLLFCSQVRHLQKLALAIRINEDE